MNTTQLTQLPLSDRIQAMEALWDSLCRDDAYDASPAWHEAVLKTRLVELERGQVVSWPDAKQRLLLVAASARQ
jgi:hypothetical protein